VQSQFASLQVPGKGLFGALPAVIGDPVGHLFSSCHQPGLTHYNSAILLHKIDVKSLTPNTVGNANA